MRPYQVDAVEAGVRFFREEARYNAIEMLPTGSGKSLVIAGIAQMLEEPVLVFQPSKEILEQNLGKYQSYGYRAGVYSASMGKKEIGHVTFATIGSVRRKSELFQHFRHVIVDECHYVNSKRGMYSSFLAEMEGSKILGLTATPYRLVTDGFGGSILKFLTRTRPRVFERLIYYVQNGDLFRDGYLTRIKYTSVGGFDRRKMRVNSTGADFDDGSVRRYYSASGFIERVAVEVRRAMTERRNVLVFVRFVEDGQALMRLVPGVEMVTAETPRRAREGVIWRFRNGLTTAVCNVGVLSTGFDYPELETVVLARPTMSLSLYYQMIGRGVRPHPDKEHTEVIDLCANYPLFGRVEDLRLVDGGHGMWHLEGNGRKLTNIYYGERAGSAEREAWKGSPYRTGARDPGGQLVMGPIAGQAKRRWR